MGKNLELIKKEEHSLPVLALRGLVIFPGMLLQFDVGRKKSILALSHAMDVDQQILLVAQKDLGDNEPNGDQIYRVGVVAKIKQVIRHTEEGVRLFAEGIGRAEIVSVTSESPFLLAEVRELETKAYRPSHKTEALIRYTQDLFEEYIQNYSRIPPDIVIGVVQKKDCGELADYIASNIMLDYDKKQAILEELSPVKRLEKLVDELKNEIQVLSIETQISEKAKESINENQREYYLREQMRAISDELGEDDNPQEEADDLRERIAKMKLPKLQNDKLMKECDRLSKMPYGSHEGSVILSYIETCLELPWNTSGKEHIDLEKAQKVLDHDHYGLTKVKERIVEVLAVKKLAPDIRGQIICLVGPPGVGKTSIARSIARAVGRSYVRVSLGGVRDESDIMGHRRTYIGSMPGRIISALKQAGTNNPLILLDEIDKLGNDFRGDPSSALLEVLDPEQNFAFSDHYLELPYDLSKVMFVTTANNLNTIPLALLDRMEVIEFPGYIEEEKLEICRRFLIPRQMEESGLEEGELQFDEAALRKVIREYTYEAGVRNLERELGQLCRKTARLKAEKKHFAKTLSVGAIEKFLGPPQFYFAEAERKDEVGVATAIAWTENGGDIMPVEVLVMEGKGSLQITGQIGEVMQESAQAALSYLKSRVDTFNIDPDVFEELDIHIHIPEGAIPKDGPSAGITIATALISAFTERPVRKEVSMTGEITLRGNVLPIGGVREKILAAHRAGLKTVMLPEKNAKDLVEVPKKVREDLKIIFVRHMDEVIDVALAPAADTPSKFLKKVHEKNKRAKKAEESHE